MTYRRPFFLSPTCRPHDEILKRIVMLHPREMMEDVFLWTYDGNCLAYAKGIAELDVTTAAAIERLVRFGKEEEDMRGIDFGEIAGGVFAPLVGGEFVDFDRAVVGLLVPRRGDFEAGEFEGLGDVGDFELTRVAG